MSNVHKEGNMCFHFAHLTFDFPYFRSPPRSKFLDDYAGNYYNDFFCRYLKKKMLENRYLLVKYRMKIKIEMEQACIRILSMQIPHIEVNFNLDYLTLR